MAIEATKQGTQMRKFRILSRTLFFFLQKDGHFYIRCDSPNENMFHFDGQVEFLDNNTEKVKRTIELSHFNFLPQGCVVFWVQYSEVQEPE